MNATWLALNVMWYDLNLAPWVVVIPLTLLVALVVFEIWHNKGGMK